MAPACRGSSRHLAAARTRMERFLELGGQTPDVEKGEIEPLLDELARDG